jgi:hypothetical protein
MESTTSKKPRQPGPVENARLPYVQIPTALLCLPPCERAAAIEVWATLHYHLRLGVTLCRITDRELARSPFLTGRSRRHRLNGLEILEREGCVRRESAGSSRRLAIIARLRGPKPARRTIKAQAATEIPVDRLDHAPEVQPTQWDVDYWSKHPNLSKLFASCAHDGAHIARTDPRAHARHTPGD